MSLLNPFDDRDRRPRLAAVVGGQFGSEGKGNVVAHIADRFATHVRVGSANAGHTFYVDGQRLVCQQLPVAAYANPQAVCVLGPGALISPGILAAEVARNREWRRQRSLAPLDLVVDGRAHLIGDEQVGRERAGDLAARIGSTSATAGEGIGVAQADRVLRAERCVRADDPDADLPAGVRVIDTVRLLADRETSGVLLEGTQGTGLSLTTGLFPFVTSRGTSASGLAADCGVPARRLQHVVMVCRTFPIRVAGNSGPFWEGSREITWEQVGVTPERTTVTGKPRRVASLSVEQVRYASQVNGATELVLMFGDYVNPGVYASTGRDEDVGTPLGARLEAMIDAIEDACRLPVTAVGTGPATLCSRPSGFESGPAARGHVRALRLRAPQLTYDTAPT